MKDRIQLYDKAFKPFIPHGRIMEAIDGVARKVNEDFRGCTDVPVVLCVLFLLCALLSFRLTEG